MIVGRSYLYKEGIPDSVRILYDKICHAYLTEHGIPSSVNGGDLFILFCDLGHGEPPTPFQNTVIIHVNRKKIVELCKTLNYDPQDLTILLKLQMESSKKAINKEVKQFAKSCYEALYKQSETRMLKLQQLALENEALGGIQQLLQQADALPPLLVSSSRTQGEEAKEFDD